LAWFFCGGEVGTSAGVVGSVGVSSAAEVRLGVERERRDMGNYELRRVLGEYQGGNTKKGRRKNQWLNPKMERESHCIFYVLCTDGM